MIRWVTRIVWVMKVKIFGNDDVGGEISDDVEDFCCVSADVLLYGQKRVSQCCLRTMECHNDDSMMT